MFSVRVREAESAVVAQLVEQLALNRQSVQMNKHCTTCHQDKSEDEFATNKSKPDGRHSQCRSCKKNYNAGYYERTKGVHNPGRKDRRNRQIAANRQNLLDYLRYHPCVDCGESDVVVLDFDHRSNKLRNVSRMVSAGTSWDSILAEIAKCDVVCANDHRRRTAKSQDWFKQRAQ